MYEFLDFARKQTAIPRVLSLNATVEGMLKMLRRLIGENIELKWNPGKEIWAVRIDPSQLDQILANLCVNARDAISENGIVEISTENVEVNASESLKIPESIPGSYVLLSVKDNGHGMDEATLEKLFEPFFTTKEIGHGTGLGLATVYGIVKQNSGFIKVFSSKDQGTSFKIYFPRFEGRIDKNRENSGNDELKKGCGTILLVEDETMILNMAKIMLEKLGYTVLSASSPGLALSLAKSSSTKIDLLLTDVVMPEMNGSELARLIKEVFPDVKVVYISGYTANVIAPHGVLNDGVNFIQKPFSLNRLSAKLKEVLR